MPWVAPSVAAEIWGISVDQVMAGIASGSVQSFVDGQFLFVDLWGNAKNPAESSSRPSVVTRQEFNALTFVPRPSEEESAECQETERGDSPTHDVGQWREERTQTARLRQAPRAEAA